MCPGSVPHGRSGLPKLEEDDYKEAAMEGAQRETASTPAEIRRSWCGASKAGKKWAAMRSDGSMAATRENVTQEVVAATSGQEGLVFVIEDSVSPFSEAAAGATPAEVSSVPVTSKV